jgi:hypothetical protein
MFDGQLDNILRSNFKKMINDSFIFDIEYSYE